MDSEIVNWLINNLPKLNLGGVDLTMPVWGGIRIVAIGGFLLSLFNFLTNVRSWIHKPPLEADGRLAPSDAFIPDYLRQQIAAAE